MKMVAPVFAGESPAPSLPKRSRRIAKQPLVKIVSSKRAEVLLMQRFGGVPAQEEHSSQPRTRLLNILMLTLASNTWTQLGALPVPEEEWDATTCIAGLMRRLLLLWLFLGSMEASAWLHVGAKHLVGMVER
jgi:hypothetical protein